MRKDFARAASRAFAIAFGLAASAVSLFAAPPGELDLAEDGIGVELQALQALNPSTADPDAAAPSARQVGSPGAFRAGKRQRPALVAAAAKSPGAAKLVECSKGQSLQAAIDVGTSPMTLDVRGICLENVRIEQKLVTLRGLDPQNDGVQGLLNNFPAVAVLYSNQVTIENLGIRNGAASGLGLYHSQVTISNSLLTENALNGVFAFGGSLLDAEGLTISDNGRHGIHADRASDVFCVECTLENNTQWAARSDQSSVVSLQDSTVSGVRGLLALFGGYADVDCASVVTSSPCSLTVTGFAGFASNHATVAFYGSQEFSGSIFALDQSHIHLFGAQQQPLGEIQIANFSSLFAEPEAQEAHLQMTSVTEFSHVVLGDATVLEGDLTCDVGGDAWLAPTAVKGPGVDVTNCENVPPPP